MEHTTATPDQIDDPQRTEPEREDPTTRSNRGSRQKEEEKQRQRQNGGRDDAGDDEDLAKAPGTMDEEPLNRSGGENPEGDDHQGVPPGHGRRGGKTGETNDDETR